MIIAFLIAFKWVGSVTEHNNNKPMNRESRNANFMYLPICNLKLPNLAFDYLAIIIFSISLFKKLNFFELALQSEFTLILIVL